MCSQQKLLTICMIAITFVVVINCSKKEVKPICINGSTTIEPYIKHVVAEYEKTENVTITISAKGSKSGLDALISGACDIAMSSSEILLEQSASAEKQGVTIKSFLLGYDIIVPIVNPQNQVSNISFAQLQDIFSGKVQKWSVLGGKDTLIDVINRGTYSGTYHVWNRIVRTIDSLHHPSPAQPSNSSILAYISEHENAIGYVSSVYINPEVKPLTIDGLMLNDRDRLIERHPVKRPLYLYVNEVKFTGEVKKFIVHVLMNQRARKIFIEKGFTPKDFSQDKPALSD